LGHNYTVVCTLVCIFLLAQLALPVCYSDNVITERILRPIADSFAWGEKPWQNNNYGQSQVLYALDSTLIFIKFNLSIIPIGSSIKSAFLSLRTPDNYGYDETPVSVYLCLNNAWEENTICWNNKPFVPNDYDLLDTVTIYPGKLNLNPALLIIGSWYSWNVTRVFSPYIELTDQELTLVLCSGTPKMPYSYPEFCSRETENAPTLIVSYVEPTSSSQSYSNQPGWIGNLELMALASTIACVIGIVLIFVISAHFTKRQKRLESEPTPSLTEARFSLV
jgi:hypothetical protein